MSLITTGGMIGVGKTTAAKIIAEHFDSDLYLENVQGNKMLELFYTAPAAEQRAKRYPFLLQLSFLNSRFGDIKRALVERNAVLDRSIYEDWYFAKVNTDRGNISIPEFHLCEELLANMMEELQALPKKSPDVFVFLDAGFDTIMQRIRNRNRDFERSDELTSYYYDLWSGYKHWVTGVYDQSSVLVFDTEAHDLSDPDSQDLLVNQVQMALAGDRHPVFA